MTTNPSLISVSYLFTIDGMYISSAESAQFDSVRIDKDLVISSKQDLPTNREITRFFDEPIWKLDFALLRR